MTKVQDIKIEIDPLLIKNIPNKIMENVMQIANTFIQEDGLDASSIMVITTNVMDVLGKYNTITGHDKKKLVILIINAVIDQTSLDEETQTVLQEMVKTTIPTAIDLFVAVSKGKYKFKYVKRFFTCCN
jgi:membrane protease subunit (stomatin/prohibitin family)